MAKEKLKWTNVNVDTLPPKVKKLYNEYRKQAKIAGDLRAKFNAEFTNSINGRVEPPEDMDNPRLVVGHGFGKLSFAWSDAPARGQNDEFSF